ncbi:MAG: lysozyme [Chloroflexia bacterium]|nr:lysozyme [Chloroflexia bacterium]
MINESISIEDLKEILKKTKNVKNLFKNTIKKFNKSTGKSRRSLAAILIILMYMSGAQGKMDPRELVPKIDKLSSVESIRDDITPQDLLNRYLNDPRFNIIKKIDNFNISEEGIEMIKSHELLRLTAYSWGDGKVTIGWGHAEPIQKTKMVPGKTKITKEKADQLF